MDEAANHKNDSTSDSFIDANLQWEPHFWVAQGHQLTNNSVLDKKRLLVYLNYRIKQQPSALIFHTQKILLCINEAYVAELFIALTDLFLILNNAGSLLKARLLNYSKRLLQPEQIDCLNKERLSNSPINDEIWIPADCLCRTIRLPENSNNTSTAKKSSLQEKIETEINDYIENGQLAEAIDALEYYLKKHPEDAQLTNTMVDLCSAHKTPVRFLELFGSLNQNNDLPAHWIDAKSKLIADSSRRSPQ